jgi:hypothetical protein
MKKERHERKETEYNKREQKRNTFMEGEDRNEGR